MRSAGARPQARVVLRVGGGRLRARLRRALRAHAAVGGHAEQRGRLVAVYVHDVDVVLVHRLHVHFIISWQCYDATTMMSC